MRILAGFCFALLVSTGLPAQNRSGFVNPLPGSTPAFGSVVFPGGTSALPGVQRTVGSVVHPGGGFPQIGVPGLPFQRIQGQNAARPFRRNGSAVFAYPVGVPVYVGGYGNGYDETAPIGMTPPPAQQQSQPNIIVIYPPAAPAYSYAPGVTATPQSNIVEVPPEQTQPAESAGATHYMLAFKDHSIYSAIAYWVDGDTLHYFTSGNTHNQVSLSLVDRDLTKRLNEGSGLEVKLPAAK